MSYQDSIAVQIANMIKTRYPFLDVSVNGDRISITITKDYILSKIAEVVDPQLKPLISTATMSDKGITVTFSLSQVFNMLQASGIGGGGAVR